MDFNSFSLEYLRFLTVSMQILDSLFIFALGTGCLWLGILYIIDKRQTTHTVRRNYPVIGRFRYLFEHIGEFFRQYFFAGDREEMPFNRAQRTWIYRAAKNVDRTVAFGSSKPVKERGSILFLNGFNPTLEDEARETSSVVIGPGTRFPYQPGSLFNISGMSFGALSVPAVRALSQGAARSGCWMNTGEGGISPYHLESGCDLIYQIGTAKYGVRNADGNLDDNRLQEVAAHEQIRMFEIKLSQGAKPGKGGDFAGSQSD